MGDSANNCVYLDNASTTYPKPRCVYDVLSSYLQAEGANPGRAGHRMAIEAGRTVEETRQLLASFFDADESESVAFTYNCTDALNIGIKGCIRSGDHVITTSIEHNSIMRPLKQMEKIGIITLTQLPVSAEGYFDPDEVSKAMTSKTRLVALSHASNVLGTVQPIEEAGRICRERGALLLVDVAQTAGILPVSMKKFEIDLLAMPGHKALFGPPGTGALIVGKRAEIVAFREGGTGVNSEHPTHPPEMPTRLEAGTPNTIGIAALKAGLEFIIKETPQAIAAHEQALLKQFIEGIGDTPGIKLYGGKETDRRVATVSLGIDGATPADIAATLDSKFNIAIRPGLHCAPYIHRQLGTAPHGTVRVSMGYFNTKDDVDYCLTALRQLAS
jgi:cysteine desulfurase / selenocysteine lyase